MGGDRFSIAARRGLQVQWVRYRNKINSLEGIAWIRSLIDELHPARVNVDSGNIGAAIITGLKSIGSHYAEIVRGVNFGNTSQFKLATPKVAGPANRRAEMWGRMRDWLLLAEGVSIPDDAALQTDLTAPRLKPKLNHDYLLESKEEMKARKVRSPDLADAVALTFAQNEFLTNYVDAPKVSSFGNPEAPRPDALQYLPPMPAVPQGWMG